MAFRQRPSARTWTLVVLELVAAAVIAWLLVLRPEEEPRRHPIPVVPASRVPAWGWPEYLVGLIVVAAVLWWLATRYPIAALTAGLAVVALTCLSTVRVLVVHSQLFTMVVLELLLVAAPLLLLAAVKTPRRDGRPAGWGGTETVLAVLAALAYTGLLIGVQLPAARAAIVRAGAVPLWSVPIAVVVGVCYWAAVLRTSARVPRPVRLAVLLGGQEIAGFIGLLSLFGVWVPIGNTAPLGLSAAGDQRLGGIVMLAASAAVAIPLARRLQADRGPDDRTALG